MSKILSYIPGLVLLGIISAGATLISGVLPEYVGAVFIAVLLGIIINNTIDLDPALFNPGVKLGLKKLLKIAIVLLGGTISFQQLAEVGGKGLLVIVLIITLAFSLTFWLGNKLGLSTRLKILIAAGLSICGNTAIITTAPVIQADDDEVFVGVSIVTLFGVAAVFIYPFLGFIFNISDQIFGAWAGTAINDTSQVVAAGFIFSEAAGKIATMIKLSRNILMVPVIMLIGYFFNRNLSGEAEKAELSIISLFPNFILGFLFLIFLNSLGLIPEQVGGFFSRASKLLILLALSGIGLGVNAADLKKVGWKPFMVGFSVALTMAVTSLLVNILLFS